MTAEPYNDKDRARFIMHPDDFRENEIALRGAEWPLERMLVEPLRLIVAERDWSIRLAASAQGETLTAEQVAEIVSRSPRLVDSVVIDGNRIYCPHTGSELIVEV